MFITCILCMHVHNMHFMIWYIDDVYSQSNSIGVLTPILKYEEKISLKLEFY